MKKLVLSAALAVGAALPASAGESLFPRLLPPGFGRARLVQQDPLELPPIEDPAFQEGANYGPAPESQADVTLPQPAPGAVYYGDPSTEGQIVQPGAPEYYGEPSLGPAPEGVWPGAPMDPSAGLYPNVKIEDPEKIAPCAVPLIVQVPMPCNKGCGPSVASVQIMVPSSCGEPRVKRSWFKNKVKYDYGKYEIEVEADRDGVVEVDYDSSFLNHLN